MEGKRKGKTKRAEHQLNPILKTRDSTSLISPQVSALIEYLLSSRYLQYTSIDHIDHRLSLQLGNKASSGQGAHRDSRRDGLQRRGTITNRKYARDTSLVKRLQCLDIASFRQSQRKLVGKGAIDFGLGIVDLEPPPEINHLFSHCWSVARKLTKKPSCFVFASSK